MPSPEKKLTSAQLKELKILHEFEYIIWPTSYRGLTRHKPLQYLVDIGLAQIGDGPKGSWLKTICYMPLWSDPIC